MNSLSVNVGDVSVPCYVFTCLQGTEGIPRWLLDSSYAQKCLCICTHMHTCTCTYTYSHTCTCIWTHTCTYTCAHTIPCTHMHMYFNLHTQTPAHDLQTHISLHTHAPAYTPTHTHTTLQFFWDFHFHIYICEQNFFFFPREPDAVPSIASRWW